MKVSLAFPQAAILRMLAYFWYMPIMPKEADGGFDPLKEMRGSGPWMQTKYQVDIGAEYRRNPNYYDADKYPYLDGIDYPLITENVQLLSQLKAKNVWGYGSTAGDLGAGPSQDQVLLLKNENPGINLVPQYNLNSRGTTSQVINFSKRENSPLKDARIRQAASMVFDRDTFIDVFYNVSGFADAGIDVPYEWNSHVAASWGDKYWIDPRKQAKKLGDGAKYFEFNPEEAAKLLRAANAFGLRGDLHLPRQPRWLRWRQLPEGMRSHDRHAEQGRPVQADAADPRLLHRDHAEVDLLQGRLRRHHAAAAGRPTRTWTSGSGRSTHRPAATPTSTSRFPA